MTQIPSHLVALALAVVVTTPTLAQSKRGTTSAVAVGNAKWWIEPLENKSSGDGHLYLAGVVENRGDVEMNIGVVFTAYSADGTPFVGCNGIGEPVEPVAPRERALIYCSRSIVPLSTKDLQVTMRIEDVARINKPSSSHALPSQPVMQRVDSTEYSASLRVSASTPKDERVSARFRFYDAQNVQIGYCDSDTYTLQPEVKLNLRCQSSVIIPTGVGIPATVRAELRGQ